MNEKTARNRAEYYFTTGRNGYQQYGIVEKLLD
jgi:hypothetical protein